MIKKIAVCPQCKTKNLCEGEPGKKLVIKCRNCGKKGIITFTKKIEEKTPVQQQTEKQILDKDQTDLIPNMEISKEETSEITKKEDLEIKKTYEEIEIPKQTTEIEKQEKEEIKPEPEIQIEPPQTKNENYSDLDFYSVNEPFAYIKILKDNETLDKFYKIIEPNLSYEESSTLKNIEEKLIDSINVRLDELDPEYVENFLFEQINLLISNHAMEADELLIKKYLYYVKRDFLGYGRIDSLMNDPNIEDISCDGSEVPIFLYHRKFGSLKSNILFDDEEELSAFVVKLAQKCGKHISIAEPMLDATMPDGSRIQMTLSKAITTKGSTFTIRKFRADPITATDLIEYNTMSPEMVAYMWMAVENGISALIAGSTAAGKTSTLNALCLFIPKESKIVSIEETREINLPHPNWIPGIARSGFGEVVHDKLAGEIDLFDLMKAALRQRPEYILVGEIRGREAYVLFQAMATGHTTYSTFHADSPKSCIHRLEGKPIDVPRVMLKCLDIIFIQVSTKLGPKHVRRCKQIVEIVDIDPTTKEILMNEVFRWDPVDDKFIYSGKSYILERIRSQYDMSKDEIMQEVKRRVEVLQWMRKKDIRLFQDVARTVVHYVESPEELMEKIRKNEDLKKKEPQKKEIIETSETKESEDEPSEKDPNQQPSQEQEKKINKKEILEG
jgi:flagellar protein FlaI